MFHTLRNRWIIWRNYVIYTTMQLMTKYKKWIFSKRDVTEISELLGTSIKYRWSLFHCFLYSIAVKWIYQNILQHFDIWIHTSKGNLKHPPSKIDVSYFIELNKFYSGKNLRKNSLLRLSTSSCSKISKKWSSLNRVGSRGHCKHRYPFWLIAKPLIDTFLLMTAIVMNLNSKRPVLLCEPSLCLISSIIICHILAYII